MTLSPLLQREIAGLIKGRVLTQVPLSRFTSFKIGGPADLLVEPSGPEEVASLLRYLHPRGISYFLLGSGTNVLFHDAGFRGVVIRTAAIRGFAVEQNGSDHARIIVAAGVPLPALISRAAALGWEGLEPLWGIPGSFGGAIVTNAGAGEVSLGDLLIRAKLMSAAGEEIIAEKEKLGFAYRSTKLPANSVVVEGTLRLRRGNQQTIEANMAEARLRRRSTQPLDKPSPGCIFKNLAPDNPAGAIIDRLGFKGTRVGDAQVSEVHANFIVNLGKATAADVLELIEKIRIRVKAEENVDLELEICVMGEERSDV